MSHERLSCTRRFGSRILFHCTELNSQAMNWWVVVCTDVRIFVLSPLGELLWGPLSFVTTWCPRDHICRGKERIKR
jgi:hypothetical protein